MEHWGLGPNTQGQNIKGLPSRDHEQGGEGEGLAALSACAARGGGVSRLMCLSSPYSTLIECLYPVHDKILLIFGHLREDRQR